MTTGKSDLVSIRVPYKNLHDDSSAPELELVDVHHRGNHRNSPPPNHSPSPPNSNNAPLLHLVLSCTVAAGVQFGWALQLSLLTPYIQTLGIGHAFSSFIWLCGPITGLVVQPCVGIWSDKCTSRFGRRRPFILAGSLMICLAVILIGFSADIGYVLGDTHEHCRTFKGTRTRAALVFILGFWMLDLANNTVQGPARALLADLSGPDQRNVANAVFCSWMAVGNILGYSSGASGKWNNCLCNVHSACAFSSNSMVFFLDTRACCEACGNLKAAFLVAVVFLTLCTLVTLYFADEVPLTTASQHHHLSDSSPLLDEQQQNGVEFSKLKPSSVMDESNSTQTEDHIEKDAELKHGNFKAGEDHAENVMDGPGAVLVNLLTSLRHLPPAMHSVLVVMALTWLSWFPFFLFDTDWMGREVYHGDPKGGTSEVDLYDQGVREGAFGLLLNSVVLGISSFFIEPMCKWMGAKLVWALSNFIVFVCMASTAIISLISIRDYSGGIEHVIGANEAIKIASLVVFVLLGFPLAITYSVPFAVTAELTADSGGGQGLAIGVLNLAIVIPQMIISLGSGPWDALFGGGNIPAFVLASLCALAGGVIATLKLPDLSSSSFQSTGFHIG
uniref:Sucrose transport protein SUC3 n=1 Tax=Glycine max TaxID=3847 RepID=I1N171_SOYBN